MAVLLGLYGLPQEIYGESLLPFFDSLIDRHQPGEMVSELQLAGEVEFRLPKYASVKRLTDNGKYAGIRVLHVSPAAGATELLENPDLDICFAHQDWPWADWHLSVYIGQAREPNAEAREILALVPAFLQVRFGFCAALTSNSDPSGVVNGWGGYEFRAASFYEAGKGRHLVDQMRDVFTLNILSEDHLARAVDGGTLRQWIEVGGRGGLTQWRDGVWIWEVPEDRVDEFRRDLEAANVLLPPSKGYVESDIVDSDDQESDPISVIVIDRQKRDALVAKMQAAAPGYATVSLEEFFEGNDGPGSIWSNLPTPVSPDKAYALLRKVRERDDVNDVRLVLKQFDGGENEWPFTDTIAIVTSRDVKACRGWFGRKHKPDEISVEDASPDDFSPHLKIPPGMKLLLAWWD